MADPNGWPDDASELIEWSLAVHFSGDKMPHMSGDPRNRLTPGARRRMEDARDAVLDALAPLIAAREAAAYRRGAEAMRGEAAQYLLTLSASSPRWGSPEEHAESIRALPIPEDKP